MKKLSHDKVLQVALKQAVRILRPIHQDRPIEKAAKVAARIARAYARIADTLDDTKNYGDVEHIFATACWVVTEDIDLDDIEVHPYSDAGGRLAEFFDGLHESRSLIAQFEQRRTQRGVIESLEQTKLYKEKFERERETLTNTLATTKGKQRRKLRSDLDKTVKHLAYLDNAITKETDELNKIPEPDRQALAGRAKALALLSFRESV